MTKPVCCLLLALGLAACKAPKATVVENEKPPVTGTRKQAARTTPTSGETEESRNQLVNRESGMIMPSLENKLPDKRDMTATTPVGPGGGGTVATPPTADKRGEGVVSRHGGSCR